MIADTTLRTDPRPGPDKRDPALWRAAQDLEKTFLAEMLRSAGLEGQSGAFGGGVGEDQFASFLRGEQAAALTTAGGIGLSETIYRALLAGGDDAA